MEKKTAGNIREYSLLGIVVIGVYIGFKYLSPLAAPFLFAFAFVAALHPMLERVQNKYYLNLEIFDENIHPLHNKPLDSRSIHPKLLLNPITAISNKNAEFLLK